MDVASLPANLPAALLERAAASPEEPWLFYPAHFDWAWQSYLQVADRVARGAAALSDLPPGSRVALEATYHPDAVAALLAIEAAGHLAVPCQNGTDERPFVPPAVRGRLERIPAPELELRASGGSEPWRWATTLEEGLPDFAGRPIVLASAGLGGAWLPVLLAWTLLANAAWVFEDDPDLFVEAALRTRPSFAIAPSAELERLRTALGEKRHRRWHRLRAVASPGGVVAEDGWRVLGAVSVRLPCPGPKGNVGRGPSPPR